jgi:hypothetical protein
MQVLEPLGDPSAHNQQIEHHVDIRSWHGTILVHRRGAAARHQLSSGRDLGDDQRRVWHVCDRGHPER